MQDRLKTGGAGRVAALKVQAKIKSIQKAIEAKGGQVEASQMVSLLGTSNAPSVVEICSPPQRIVTTHRPFKGKKKRMQDRNDKQGATSQLEGCDDLCSALNGIEGMEMTSHPRCTIVQDEDFGEVQIVNDANCTPELDANGETNPPTHISPVCSSPVFAVSPTVLAEQVNPLGADLNDTRQVEPIESTREECLIDSRLKKSEKKERRKHGDKNTRFKDHALEKSDSWCRYKFDSKRDHIWEGKGWRVKGHYEVCTKHSFRLGIDCHNIDYCESKSEASFPYMPLLQKANDFHIVALQSWVLSIPCIVTTIHLHIEHGVMQLKF